MCFIFEATNTLKAWKGCMTLSMHLLLESTTLVSFYSWFLLDFLPERAWWSVTRRARLWEFFCSRWAAHVDRKQDRKEKVQRLGSGQPPHFPPPDAVPPFRGWMSPKQEEGWAWWLHFSAFSLSLYTRDKRKCHVCELQDNLYANYFKINGFSILMKEKTFILKRYFPVNSLSKGIFI